MKKDKATTKWIACMLTLFTFFVLFSVNVLSDSGNIHANLVVIPQEKTFCFPQTLIVKEGFGNVACFIEITSATPDIINVSSLRLGISENSSAGIPPIAGSVTYINDFNNNGVRDLFVQFDFSKFKNFFSGMTLPANYHYRIGGNINITPFSFEQIDNLFAKLNVSQPSRSTRFIDYYTSFTGNGGNIVVAKDFHLSKFAPYTNRLDGYVVQRVNYPSENVNSWGVLIYSSMGYLTVDNTVFSWLPPFFSMKVSQSFFVVDDGAHSCSSTTNSITICQSSGWMIRQSSGIFGDSGQTQIKTLIYIISPSATKIFGFDSSNNKILEIENIHLNSLQTSTIIPY